MENGFNNVSSSATGDGWKLQEELPEGQLLHLAMARVPKDYWTLS
jgi:hypothetical protein